jgi:hypothetical protein
LSRPFVKKGLSALGVNMSNYLDGVYVTIKHEPKYKLIETDVMKSQTMSLGYTAQDRATLFLRGEIVADVEISYGQDANEYTIVSCLAAGLMNLVDEPNGHYVLKAISQIESQLGFKVDRSVSPKIAKIIPDSKTTRYKIQVTNPIGMERMKYKFFKSFPYNGKICYTIKTYHNAQSYCVSDSYDTYEDIDGPKPYHADYEIYSNLFENLYVGFPEKSAEFCQIKNDFINDVLSGKYFSDDPLLSYPNEIQHYAKDPRVDKLPGLREIVRNPATNEPMMLERAIINLNDIQKWTREAIADWLETLDIDISFRGENE